MKKLLFIILPFVLLTACGGPGILPTDNITLGQAFAHCTSTTSYWLWIGIVLAASGLICLLWYRAEKNAEVNVYVKLILTFIMVAAIISSIFMRPCDVAANTSVEMMQRGHYLGY